MLAAITSQAQVVTYEFTDGSVVSHAITEVRSTDFDGDAMRVFLWDGTTYTWSLGSLAHYQFTDISTAAVNEASGLAPVRVYPNPTSGEVRIGIQADGSGEADVQVLDARGVRIRSVHRGELASGKHELVWDGLDEVRQPVAAGNYLLRVVQGPRVATKQVILQR